MAELRGNTVARARARRAKRRVRSGNSPTSDGGRAFLPDTREGTFAVPVDLAEVFALYAVGSEDDLVHALDEGDEEG
jgi:hypothetical protein